jgi:uncharacterized membrane protein HdeD (DUF308 family)
MAFNMTSPHGQDAVGILRRLSRALFRAGLVMAALGLGALLMPVFSTLVVGVLIGWLLFFGGIVAVAGALAVRGTGVFPWQLMGGLIPLLAGGFLIVFPAQGVTALTVLVAIVLVLTGIAQSAFAVWARPAAGWGWGLASAGISIVLGGYILVALPQASEVILGILVGIDFLSSGLAMILIARAARPVPRNWNA